MEKLDTLLVNGMIYTMECEYKLLLLSETVVK